MEGTHGSIAWPRKLLPASPVPRFRDAVRAWSDWQPSAFMTSLAERIGKSRILRI